MGKQFGHIILEKVLLMKAKGQTHREIAKELGFKQEQIDRLVKRHNARQRKIAAGIALNRKGRPPKGYAVTEQDKVSDLRYKLTRKDYRI